MSGAQGTGEPGTDPVVAVGSEPAEEVGDPVCWLNSVCPECGRLAEDRSAEVCGVCGADLPER